MTVLKVDLELSSGEQILIDPGLSVPKHGERTSVSCHLSALSNSPDCPPQSVARPAVDVDLLLDG